MSSLTTYVNPTSGTHTNYLRLSYFDRPPLRLGEPKSLTGGGEEQGLVRTEIETNIKGTEKPLSTLLCRVGYFSEGLRGVPSKNEVLEVPRPYSRSFTRTTGRHRCTSQNLL